MAITTSAGFDLDSLSAQLRSNGVAIDASASVNAATDGALNASLVNALAQPAAGGLENAGVVVVGPEQASGPELRDVAQDLQLATHLDTVIIRTPNAAIAVSEDLTRAQIERGQRAMVSQPDYAQGIADFAGAAEGFSVWWGLAAIVAVAAIVATVCATAQAVRSAK